MDLEQLSSIAECAGVVASLVGLVLWVPTALTRRLARRHLGAWDWMNAPAAPDERASYRTGAEARASRAAPPREVRRAAWLSFALAQTGALWALWIAGVMAGLAALTVENFQANRADVLCALVPALVALGFGWLGVVAALDRARMGGALLRADLRVEEAFAKMRSLNEPLQWMLLVFYGLAALLGLWAARDGGADRAPLALPVSLGVSAIAPRVVGWLHARSVRRAVGVIVRRQAGEAARVEPRP